MITQKLWKNLQLNCKIRAQLSESAHSLDVKSIKSLHATKWTKIVNEMKASVNFDMGTSSTYKDTFINNGRAK